MHICPQEIMAVVQTAEMLRPALGMINFWCFNRIHNLCQEHITDAILSQHMISND